MEDYYSLHHLVCILTCLKHLTCFITLMYRRIINTLYQPEFKKPAHCSNAFGLIWVLSLALYDFKAPYTLTVNNNINCNLCLHLKHKKVMILRLCLNQLHLIYSISTASNVSGNAFDSYRVDIDQHLLTLIYFANSARILQSSCN